MMMMGVVDWREGPIEPNLFVFSDCNCLLHHALPPVFTHCAKMIMDLKLVRGRKNKIYSSLITNQKRTVAYQPENAGQAVSG